MDHNGSVVNLALIMGELRANSHHTIDAIHRLADSMDRQTEILIDLPTEIASRIAVTQTTSIPPQDEPTTQGILKCIPPIFTAAAALLTVIGLMTGGVAWSDIPQIAGLGGYVSSK